MSGVGDLVAFLRAQLDAEADVARAALELAPPDVQARTKWNTLPHGRRATELGISPEAVLHASVHGPVRVLADIEAKRLLLDDHPIVPETYPRPTVAGKEVGGPYYPFGCENCHGDRETGEVNGFGYCLVWKAHALPYSAHPDYKESWRP